MQKVDIQFQNSIPQGSFEFAKYGSAGQRAAMFLVGEPYLCSPTPAQPMKLAALDLSVKFP